MTAVIVAPRVEDPLSDTESVSSSGYVRIRPSRAFAAGGQWVQDVWSAPIPLAGSPLTFQLDPLTDIPYELHVHIPDGMGGDYDRHEWRIVVPSVGSLKWEDLEQRNAPGAPPGIPSNFEARLIALETAAPPSGGATSLAALTGVSTDGKALITTGQTFNSMLTSLGAAPLSTVNTNSTTIGNLTANKQDKSARGVAGGYAALDASGRVTNADGTFAGGGVVIGSVVGTATDAGRFEGHLAHTEWLILQGTPEYTNHPVTPQKCRFRGDTDPGNNGDAALGGGGMAPGDVWEQVP